MFYFYVSSAQCILQRTPCQPRWSIMHAIKNVYLCLCLFDWGTPPPTDLVMWVFLKIKPCLRLLVLTVFRNVTHWWLPVCHHCKALILSLPPSLKPREILGLAPQSTGISILSKVKPPGRLIADWWSCTTSLTDTEGRLLVESLHWERGL